VEEIYRDARSSRSSPSRVNIEDRDYEGVLEQLRVNAGFYEEKSSDRELSEIDEFELLDSDDVVDEVEEEDRGGDRASDWQNSSYCLG
jgi:hypothetical protein